MRRLTLLLLLCAPAWAAMTVTNCNTGTPASATTMTVTCSSVTAGDLLAVYAFSNNNVTVSSVSDTTNGTTGWVSGLSVATLNVPGRGSWWVTPNSGASAGTLTVTVTFSGATGGGEIALKRIANADTSSPLDGAGCSHDVGSSTNPSCALTTTNANTTLLTGVATSSGATTTVGGSYTDTQKPDTYVTVANKYVTASGSQTVNPISWTGSTGALQVAIAVKEAAGGAVATPRRRPLVFQ